MVLYIDLNVVLLQSPTRGRAMRPEAADNHPGNL